MSSELQRAAQLPARRRTDLAVFIRQNGQATIAELAEEFGVSYDTVRRDLDHLASRGLVSRTHGGAVPSGELAAADTPVLSRLHERREAKQQIGAAAATLVRDQETVIINGGTTALATVAAFGQYRGLTIVTNNLRVPSEVPASALRDLYVLGGSCRLSSQVTIGPVRMPDISGLSADLALIAVGGVCPRAGLTISNIPEAQMINEMMDSATRVAILADSSKFGRSSFARICGLDRIDMLVSEQQPGDELAAALDRSGVAVVVPD